MCDPRANGTAIKANRANFYAKRRCLTHDFVAYRCSTYAHYRRAGAESSSPVRRNARDSRFLESPDFR
jgi:hypothetical protein